MSSWYPGAAVMAGAMMTGGGGGRSGMQCKSHAAAVCSQPLDANSPPIRVGCENVGAVPSYQSGTLMVCSRSGPTPTEPTGQPTTSPKRLT